MKKKVKLCFYSLILFATLLMATGIQGKQREDGPDDSIVIPSPLKSSQSWASILCKFPDVDDEPQPKSFFKDMFEQTSGPSLTTYWNEVSHGNLSNITTDVFGWYTLPSDREIYNFGGELLQFNYDQLLADCIAAAAVEVNVEEYDYYAIFLNAEHSIAMSNIGQSAPIIPSNKINLVTVPHEMGHTYGVQNSMDIANQTSNPYDLMSSHADNCEMHQDPEDSCVAQHPIAYYKAELGFIPIEKQYMGIGTEAFTIETFDQSQPGNYWIAYARNRVTRDLYTIEARKKIGFDSHIPHEGVVIHKLEETPFGLVPTLVDGDGNGDLNDEGAIWLPGEFFHDKDGLIIHVIASTETGYRVGISTPGSSIRGNLTLDKSLLKAGDQFEATVTVTSLGAPDSIPLGVNIRQPNDVTLIQGSLQSTLGVVDEPNGRVSLPPLAPNQIATITFSYQVDPSLMNPTLLKGYVEILDDLDEVGEILSITAIANPTYIYLPTIQR